MLDSKKISLDELLESLEENFTWSFDIPEQEELSTTKPSGFLEACKNELKELKILAYLDDNEKTAYAELKKKAKEKFLEFDRLPNCPKRERLYQEWLKICAEMDEAMRRECPTLQDW